MDSMKTKQTVINVLIQVIMILVSITMLVPFLWMILTAFKTVTEATSVNPFVIFPKEWRTDAFKEVIRNMNFLLLYKNTLLMIFFRVLCAVLTAPWLVMHLDVCILREEISASPWYYCR